MWALNAEPAEITAKKKKQKNSNTSHMKRYIAIWRCVENAEIHTAFGGLNTKTNDFSLSLIRAHSHSYTHPKYLPMKNRVQPSFSTLNVQ